MSDEVEKHNLRRTIDVLRAALIDISTELEYINKAVPDHIAESLDPLIAVADKALAFKPDS